MKRYFRSLLIFLSVAGPAVITTMAGNDSNGVVTYSLSGGHFGYGHLFILPFLTLVYGLTQEIGSRIAIVSGRGLADLIRERAGVRMAVVFFVFICMANFGNVVVDAASIKTSLELFGVRGFWILPCFALIVGAIFYFVTKFDFERNQKFFLVAMALYIFYVISAFQSRPDWGLALKSLVVPTPESFTPQSIIFAIGFVGTTITPWGQLFIQSFMKDKKVSLDRLKYSKLESYVGAFISNLTTFFIIVATTSTIFVNKIILTSGEQAALAIKPFAGEAASVLYGVGLLNAGIIGLIIIGLSTSYAFTELFGFEGTLDVSLGKGKNFYLLFLFQIATASILVCFPFISVFKIASTIQIINGAMLPIIFYYVIKFATDRSIMREYVLDPIRKYLIIFTSFVLICASMFTIVYTLFIQ